MIIKIYKLKINEMSPVKFKVHYIQYGIGAFSECDWQKSAFLPTAGDNLK